jgi:hypothetical protein
MTACTRFAMRKKLQSFSGTSIMKREVINIICEEHQSIADCFCDNRVSPELRRQPRWSEASFAESLDPPIKRP